MTVSSTSTARRAELLKQPGKIRGLHRVASADGYFLVCALDHLKAHALDLQ